MACSQTSSPIPPSAPLRRIRSIGIPPRLTSRMRTLVRFRESQRPIHWPRRPHEETIPSGLPPVPIYLVTSMRCLLRLEQRACSCRIRKPFTLISMAKPCMPAISIRFRCTPVRATSPALPSTRASLPTLSQVKTSPILESISKTISPTISASCRPEGTSSPMTRLRRCRLSWKKPFLKRAATLSLATSRFLDRVLSKCSRATI